MKSRKRVFEILEGRGERDPLPRAVNLSMAGLIIFNIIVVTIETTRAADNAPHFFRVVEAGSVIVFSAEYLLRLWACVENPRFAHPVFGRLRFAATPLAMLDLFAVIPFFIPFFGMDLRSLRAGRLLRLFRLGKLGRYSRALRTMGEVIRDKKEELVTIASLMGIILLISSSVMYFVETEAQPDRFSSIPATMWWAVMTLTGAGYRDMLPVTTAGKLLGSIIAFLGIGVFALPTGLLGAAFVQQLQAKRDSDRCPHCGKELSQ